MAVRTRIEPIDRDIEVLLDGLASPEERSRTLAQFAREALADGQEINTRVLGTTPPHDTIVDRVPGASIDGVRPDGLIVFEFKLLDDVLVWISEQLVRKAPVRTGKFTASFALFADDVQVDIVDPPAGAKEYIFLNTQPYSRKIERGQSPQAPDGIFEAIAILANRRFGNTASVGFTFRSPILKYVPGAPTRKARARRRNGAASHVFVAQRVERQTRTPAITVRPR
jgi:hypothetical protein